MTRSVQFSQKSLYARRGSLPANMFAAEQLASIREPLLSTFDRLCAVINQGSTAMLTELLLSSVGSSEPPTLSPSPLYVLSYSG